METGWGEKIYRARKAKGISQEQLATAVGVSRQTVSQWENDKFQPSNDNINSLCRELGMTRDEFFEGGRVAKKSVCTIPIVILSVLTAILIFVTVVLGMICLTSNTGDMMDNSYSIPQYVFYVVLTLTIISLASDATLLFLRIKKSDK